MDIMAASNPHFTSADRERLSKLYGLDQPAPVRYYNWLKDTLSGNLGYSRTYRVPVMQLVGPRLLNTFYLSIASLVLALLLAIPLGIWTALRSGSKLDYSINLLSLAGISVPSFWLAIILIMLFSVMIPLFPASGTYSLTGDQLSWGAALLDRLKYMALPTIALTLMELGGFQRYTRSAMLEAMRNDFIRTAKAKGLRRRDVIWKHGFRNALIPLITVIAIAVGYSFSGAIITETVFAYQGIGKLVVDSVMGNDFNVAMVAFNVSVFMVLLGSLAADIFYGIADPRISHQ